MALLLPLVSRAQGVREPAPDWRYVESRLVKEGFTRSFITEMKQSYEIQGFTEVLKLNILLFLRKSDYHGPQVTGQAAQEVQEFMSANEESLRRAEKTHKVPGSVIASLLWLESRHGKNQGRFHVPSVYLHLLQAERKPVLSYLRSESRSFADKVTKAQMQKIEERTKTKATWALSELRELQKIHSWKWKIGTALRGSFSGAFGMAQFLPSSYVRWARSAKPKTQPDLSQAADAIESVAYYLRDHGWAKKKEAQIDALMEYNKSKDYANAILDLAKRVKGPDAEPVRGREPARDLGPESKPIASGNRK